MSTLSPKARFVQIHFLSTIVQSTGTFVTDRLYSLRYKSHFVCYEFEVERASCVQVSTLSPNANFVQIHFLSTTVQSTGTFVTERLYSLRYESHFVFHELEVESASFQLSVYTVTKIQLCANTLP